MDIINDHLRNNAHIIAKIVGTDVPHIVTASILLKKRLIVQICLRDLIDFADSTGLTDKFGD